MWDPVIAFRCGSVPEVMQDGASGFIVESVDRAVALTPRALEIPRASVRAYFDSRFLAERMARDYVTAYESLSETNAQANAEARIAEVA